MEWGFGMKGFYDLDSKMILITIILMWIGVEYDQDMNDKN